MTDDPTIADQEYIKGFAALELSPELLQNLQSLGYTEMTPIQAQSLPPILSGKDVIAQAKTGSGKTAAFGLGLLSKLDLPRLRAQFLVICPTRELADQVAKAIRQLARTLANVKVLTLCGGMPLKPQTNSLSHGAHIVVGTPGRLAKHLRTGNLKLDSIKMLVLDEGDRMLEMGFEDEIEAIVEAAPKTRQTLLFSATYPATIQSIVKRIMSRPVMIKVDSSHDDATIEQHFYEVGDAEDRLHALRLLLQQYRPESAVVFCATKAQTKEVCDALFYDGFSTLDLHGDLEQRDRDETLVRFANKSISVLVATDVAARGLDIDAVDVVINYYLSRDVEVHVHRIGRTGRAGSRGVAYSLFNKQEANKVSELQDYLGKPIFGEALPPSEVLDQPRVVATMATIKIKSGKKQKMRPGNILGALTGDNGLNGDQVGKINVYDNASYVAVKRELVKKALKVLGQQKWKGRAIQAWLMKD